MSWMFGGGSGGNDNDDDDNDYDDNGFEDQIDELEEYANRRGSGSSKVIADFDPEPLIQGAKALKEIDSSSNSKEVLRLAVEQERTKQMEHQRRAKEMEQQNLQYRAQQMQQEQEWKQRQREQEQEMWRQRMQEEEKRKEQLEARSLQQKTKQQDEWIEKQRRLNEENLQRQREVEKEIEEQRRRSMEYQAKLEQETARVKAEAESQGAIDRERKNEDVHLRSQKERLIEERETKLQIRKEELLSRLQMFNGFREVITDSDKMMLISKTIVGVTFGVAAARQTVRLGAKTIENRLGKPALVRDTSRWNWKDVLPSRKWLRKSSWFRGSQLQTDELKGIVLPKNVDNKMRFITRSTTMTKKNKAPFRHLLIYGPPGTGKTLFARTLARESGLDYAVLSGGDFSQLGSSAVTELHKVFDWSEASKNGTILFIDEADAFLRRGREGDNMSEHMRNALSAFLYRTGTETKDFMIVLATNVPEALDKAVLDRIDDAVEFPLPGIDERRNMLEHYFKVYITQDEEHCNQEQSMTKTKDSIPIQVSGFDTDVTIFDRLATKTDGFSGRQISKYMIQVQASMYGGMEAELTPFLMEQILETFLKSKSFGLE